MEDKLSIATSILTRAVVLDNADRLTEALVCYQEGIEILLKSVTAMPEGEKKKAFRTKTAEYMKRAEVVKDKMERLKATGTYREQIQVAEDAVGFSYTTVFSRFLDEDVCKVEVDDPYIRSAHQCDNFLRFLELCVRLCPKLKAVALLTGKDTNNYKDQLKRLTTIRQSLQSIPGSPNRPPIDFTVEFSESLHDREIRLDNGWVIKIGRGLDYFKPVERFALGWTDFDLRICKATTIDVFHRKELQRIR